MENKNKKSHLSIEDQKKVEAIKSKIDFIMTKYSKEFEELSNESEEIYERNEKLKKRYKELEEKTGYNTLFKELNNILNSKPSNK
ncbi:hypothetical protein [Aequorivita marina]|uniref:hypothetical protein n=1 Tax=Aequorivita marina TaxID=3073654 RepID=UPI002874E41B|nr:hypothetical protein [Aequorivita sp. S2608]MDS1297378.1 hypothetical protein [Aequorivita sp. S2608]